MQALGIVLLLISLGTTVGPFAALAVVYRDNLSQVVIPPQVSEIMNGDSSIFQSNVSSGSNQFLAPVFVDAQVDEEAHTFSVTVNFTNTFNYDLTLNSFAAGVVCSEHNYPLGSVGLRDTVSILAGETSQMTVSGSWTQGAEDHFSADHSGDASIGANLVNVVVDVNGITIEESGPISVGDVPLT